MAVTGRRLLLQPETLIMKRLLFFVSFVLVSSIASAQTQDQPASIGLWGGSTQYNGDLGQGFYASDQAFYAHVGLGFGYYITRHWDITANATYGSLGYRVNEFQKFRSNQTQFNTHIRFKILDSDKYRLVPYALLGLGVAVYSKYEFRPGTDLFLPFGAGLRFSVTDRLNIHIQEMFAYSDHDTRDGEVRGSNDAFVHHSIGLSYNLGSVKDEDKDGVPDKRDNCPQTPLGVKVDAKGCPLDRDGDLIADYQDSCPDVKGVLSAHGCPDRDGDGVLDSLDQCPDVAGLVALKGCPDKDNDGVTDAEDNCPDAAGTIALKGCPDRDGDNIADNEDQCPDSAGTAANHGCPEIVQPATPVVSAEQLQGPVYFNLGSSRITATYSRKLNAAAKVLNENNTVNISVEGHADNTGEAKFNQKLSEQRAAAVKKYLVRKGVNADRITTIGYGDKQPAADNNTNAGRAKNRRVELKAK